MDDVEHMREGVVHALGDKSELAQKSILRHGVRLSHNQVVSVWEKIECILEEIDRSAVDSCLHTEESDGKSVFGILRRIWDHSQVVDLLSADLLNFIVVAVQSMLFQVWQQVDFPLIRLADLLESAVFLLEGHEVSHLHFREHSIESLHAVQSVEQVVDAGEFEKDLFRLGWLHLLIKSLFQFSPIGILLIFLISLLQSELLLHFLLFGICVLSALISLHLEEHLSFPLVLCLRWDSLAVALLVLDVAEADQERGHILSHLLVKS